MILESLDCSSKNVFIMPIIIAELEFRDALKTASWTNAVKVQARTFSTTRATTLPLRLTALTTAVLPDPICPAAARLAAALIFMAIAALAADESLVNFDNTTKLFDILDQRSSSSFVGTEAHLAHDLERAHSFLADQHQASHAVPVAERLVRVLKY